MKISSSLVLALIFLGSSALLSAQEPRISPHLKADVELKDRSITISYGSPRIRGRKIMGKLVPYGQVWRTGADEATSLKTAVDLEIGGTKVRRVATRSTPCRRKGLGSSSLTSKPDNGEPNTTNRRIWRASI